MNSIILKSLRIYCKDQSDWSNIIPAILWSYRASTATSTGFSPFEILYGSKMRTPIDTSIINDVRTSPSVDAYMQQMLPKIEITREIAKQNIADCNESTQFYYNRGTAYPTYNIGDKVLLYDPVVKKGVSKKLKKRWIGPYVILSEGDGFVYKLKNCQTGKTLHTFVHSNRLKKFNDARELRVTTDQTGVDERPGATSDETPIARTQTPSLSDEWYDIKKITNKKTIGGKTHYMVHWQDGSRSYEPEENISDTAKAAYNARCQTRRKAK